MPQQNEPTGINFMVSGIVAQRNGVPYVIIDNGEKRIAQFTIAEARKVALDLLRSASYAETDAMLVGFFKRMEFPDAALSALLIEFRDFRYALDMERVSGNASDPDTGETINES